MLGRQSGSRHWKHDAVPERNRAAVTDTPALGLDPRVGIASSSFQGGDDQVVAATFGLKRHSWKPSVSIAFSMTSRDML
jgi:hypothetical protein